MATTTDVSDEYSHIATRFFQSLLMREEWGVDVYGYWSYKIPFDEELMDLKFKLAKTSYDEARHANICKKMVRHFGEDEAVEEMHERWREQEGYNWVNRMGYVFSEGLDHYIEMLALNPLFLDNIGIHFFADIAEQSPDPLLTDTAESIVEDEQLHSSISSEFLPIAIERYGDGAHEKIERTLETYLPIIYGIQGQPNSKARQKMIDAGFLTLTNEDVHEIMDEHAREIYDPLGIDVPPLDEDDYISAGEVPDYAERVCMKRMTTGDL